MACETRRLDAFCVPETQGGRTGCSSPFRRLPKATKKEEVLRSHKTSSLVRWKGLSRALADSPQDCPPRPGRKAAGRAVRAPSGDSRKQQKRRGFAFPQNLFFGALEGTLPRPCGQSAGLSAPAGTQGGRTGCSSPFQRLPKATKKEKVPCFLGTSSLVRWKGLSRALADSPQDCPPRPGRKAAGRAVRVPSGDFRKRQKRRGSLFPWNLFFGALEGTRTPGLLIRSQTLYPAELPAQVQEV